MLTGARLADLAGWPLIGVILFVSVLEYGGGVAFGWLAGALALAAIMMGITRLSRSHHIFLLVGLGLSLAALFTRADWATGLSRAVISASLIVGMFTALSALRSAAIGSPRILECGRFLARQPPGRRYAALSMGGHLFGLILLYGAISLLGTLATESAARETDPEIRYHRRRRMLVAIQRGFIATITWSPMAFSMVISIALVPGASWTGALLPCLFSAALLLVGGWALDLVFKPRLSQPPPPRVSQPGGWWRHLRPLLILLGAVLGGTIALHLLTGVEVIGAVMSLVPMVALIWVWLQARGQGLAAGAHIGTRVKAFLMAELPAYRGEITLLFMAAFIGSLGSFLMVPLVAARGIDLSVIPAPVILIALIWVIVLAGQLGMNPILAVSLMIPLLPAPEAMGLSPAVVVTAITAGWALSGASSPFTASVLLLGALGEVAPRRAGLIWNGPYVLVAGAALSVWVAALAIWL
ncbi:MAG: hypothetical protein Q4G26_06625 [Paracoccus sp. (in: a-proteobacteria)]|nr:hypothetical protein [Paracoccus sp. (in: a-proteobacteria)]